jgi:hypothetical protein
MPLIRNGTADAGRLATITRKLSGELQAPGADGQPIIWENAIAQTGRYHVTVVWDEWSDLSLQARSRAILDAYEAADPLKTGKISIAMGLTMREAMSMGMFPFAIIANVRRVDEDVAHRIENAMRSAGAVSSRGGGLELRFHTLEEAERAFARLQDAVPGPFWAITQELEPAT